MRRLQELAESIGGTVAGSEQAEILGVATIARSKQGDITFAQTQQHYDDFLKSDAAAAIVSRLVKLDPNRNAIIVDSPLESFPKIVTLFRPSVERKPIGISPQAVVSDTAIIADGVSIYPGAVVMDGAKIGAGTIVFPNVTVMENCTIGSNCKLFPNCVLYEHTQLGDRVILHAGVVLGTYGFGYKSTDMGHELSAQLGNVVIGNDVELGANTTIDRGTFDSTTVGDGTKMDDQVMVGHNCEIGQHNLLCSQVGIAGSCTTGDFVIMGGQVGMKDHLNIGDHVAIGAKSGLMHDVEPNSHIQGIPARPIRHAMQIMSLTGKLPEIRKGLKQLQKKIDAMDSAEHQEQTTRDAA